MLSKTCSPFTLFVLTLVGCGQKGDLYLRNNVFDSPLFNKLEFSLDAIIFLCGQLIIKKINYVSLR